MPDTDTIDSWVGEVSVRAGDPRWAEVGITGRMRDTWTEKGFLRVASLTNPGSGFTRRWPETEIEIGARIVRLLRAGLALGTAAWIARADGRVELAPGIWIEVTS